GAQRHQRGIGHHAPPTEKQNRPEIKPRIGLALSSSLRNVCPAGLGWLRTARASFPACSSSVGQRPCEIRPGTAPPSAHTPYGTRWPHWGPPGRYYGGAGYRSDFSGGGRTSCGRYDRADSSAVPPAPVG